MKTEAAKNFEEYARRFPRDVQRLLRKMRQTIREAAPEAEETISYRIPALRLTKILVWYGAHTDHIGFYPGAAAIAAFKDELSAYKSAKGSVQFPFDQPLPLDLVRRMVKFRVKLDTPPAPAPAAQARRRAAPRRPNAS
jgi:uncharacterized protein YdhG (YjbR/CyaY superfamily)